MVRDNSRDDIFFNNETAKGNQNVIGIEDRTFRMSFGVMKASGLWKPTRLKPALGVVYDIFTFMSFVSMVTLTVTVVVNNAISGNSIAAATENLYLILTMVNAICKGTNAYLRRDKVIGILQQYSDDRWVPRNDEERQIIKKSIVSERLITRFCIYLVTANDSMNALSPLLHPDPEHDLMVDAYSPCDRANPACFWPSYLVQVFGYVCASLVNVGSDCILFNLVDRLCAHLALLESRMLRLPGLVEGGAGSSAEINYLKDRIRDHHSVCGVGKERIHWNENAN